MKSINEADLKGKRVLVRVDFNVPLDADYNVTDNKRITAAVPTINYLRQQGAKVILMSHLGRPKGKAEDKYSLKHIVRTVSEALGAPVKFIDDCIGEKVARAVDDMKNGDVLLLENLRFYAQEEKGDEEFAKELAAVADVYVNDAFGAAHRAHASTAVIAKNFTNQRYAGYLLQAEVDNADKVLNNPKRPFTAIMGGAKVSDKLLLIENMLTKVDNLVIGGGMAYTFIKARGGEIGKSLLEEDKLQLALDIMQKAEDKGVKLYLPVDTVAAAEFKNDAETKTVAINDIPAGWMGLDIGPESIAAFTKVIQNSATIVWNGPMGVFEMDNFANGTKEVAEAIAKATESGAFSLIGGGDSAAAIAKFGLEDRVSYVSTGGGALLEYMEGKELPGVASLNK